MVLMKIHPIQLQLLLDVLDLYESIHHDGMNPLNPLLHFVINRAVYSLIDQHEIPYSGHYDMKIGNPPI